ncbi:MAG: hypothetical protein ACLUEA_06080 [Romboutsia timonensis]
MKKTYKVIGYRADSKDKDSGVGRLMNKEKKIKEMEMLDKLDELKGAFETYDTIIVLDEDKELMDQVIKWSIKQMEFRDNIRIVLMLILLALVIVLC